MSEPTEHYYRRYIERTRQLRERAGYTAAEMARRLGINSPTYRQYEHRSPLPQHLIEGFARAVGCDIEHVISGRTALWSRPPTRSSPKGRPRPSSERRQRSDERTTETVVVPGG